MILNMAGGGGAGLNFKVVGGTTQPASPAENTIWVNTDAAITDWVFSSTQPAASAGRVWFCTDARSSVAFNAVKKNGIWVYPTYCQQYVGGAWVAKAANTYQNGAWADWTRYVYSYGDEYINFTGGIQLINNGYTTNKKEATYITLTRQQNTSGSGAATINKIDITPYSMLYAVYETTDENPPASNYQNIGLIDSVAFYGTMVGFAQNSQPAVGTHTLVLDLSNYSGLYYIQFVGYQTWGSLFEIGLR